LCDVWENISMM